jgi:putative aldouronate transport system permease protein
MKPLKGKKIHNDGSLGFNTVVYGFVFLSVLAILFPLLYIIMTSFASEREFYTRGFFIFPKKWTLEAYLYLITNDFFTGSFMNAIKVTVVGTSINMIATVLMAYGLSKKWLMGRKYINLIVVFTMIFSGGLIPTYMVINALGLINSYWAIWFNSAVSAFT